MSEVVKVSMQGGIAVVTVDSPPVNTLSREVRAGLKSAFESLRGKPEVKAVVLACAGKTFLSGGDMREFETGVQEPGYHEVLRLIEDSAVPVVAALYGTVMGGGLETAIACHYRVAQEGVKLGLPEITLGIIPGAGGTQRMPRLIGLEKALDMMLSAKPLTAAEAVKVSLVDTAVAGDVTAAAVAYARDLVASGKGPRRTREMSVEGREKAGEIITARRAQLGKAFRNRNSPHVLLDAVQAAAELPFDAGIARERELSSQVERAVEGRAFRHLFFGERKLRKIPGLPADVKSRKVAKVGIVGAGTMGGGIGMCFANAGIPVTIVDAKQEALDRGLATLRKNYERSVSRGSLKTEEMERRLALIQPTLDYEALGDADLVIEAVFENMALKKEIFARLDNVAKPGAILGTNTSTLDIDEIAAVTQRPQDVIGLHFFSPANVMRLLEIVQCAKTAPDVVMTALDIAKTIKKVGVVAKVCYGFIGNRMMDPYGREAERCVLEGATPEEVDGALEDFGMAMGILAVYDMAGIDIGHLTRVARAHLLPQDPTFYRPTALLTERGWLGQKSGRGYYRYDGADRKRTPDPEAIALFAEEAQRLGVPQRKPSRQEIQARCLYAMINEGALLLEEGIAIRASDIDIVYTSGYGFPRYRGGPMFYADTVGLKVIYDKILEFQKVLDPQYWQPAPLLEKLAKAGSSFAQWQAERKV
ncbi:MAG: 3-hydroxyacyl-CoA dehydrogenase [Rhodocyclaceae bacterium]|uniref:Multifunctional fatty acid oxidation complex subunit alpha n=1 Tax=Candidatus Desulfobacillus denitrificans TaxID=2608985 RepID=A0A809RZR8_9PROT|nr:multifunctional fatty acid oxidation complex subunit alpha [Candidatus Desulfobacillus denitrificans]GIK45024.1 MAG: 3-hydroxyacyl-CoA dehydrogenase [Betaproteobacteria bacterium]GJQ56669.1 MAG: 3-hydroxyacyl-CoA dehydrogenase [Rhodocyclaceae bacterium]